MLSVGKHLPFFMQPCQKYFIQELSTQSFSSHKSQETVCESAVKKQSVLDDVDDGRGSACMGAGSIW